MTIDVEQRELINKQLLSAARQGGNVEELLIEYKDPQNEESFLFDINCTDVSGNTPLHLAVLSGSIENVDLLIEANGCDVDLQNNDGDTPLHLAVKTRDSNIRQGLVSALVVDAEAVDSIRLINKAGQKPNDLAKIYCPNDVDVISWTTPPTRKVSNMIGKDDIANDDEESAGSESE